MKLVFFKSKKIYVRSTGKKKAYYRVDPRTKKKGRPKKYIDVRKKSETKKLVFPVLPNIIKKKEVPVLKKEERQRLVSGEWKEKVLSSPELARKNLTHEIWKEKAIAEHFHLNPKKRKEIEKRWASIPETDKALNTISKSGISLLKKDAEMRKKFIVENQPFVFDTIKRVQLKFYPRWADAIQDGNEGFINAIDKFKISTSSSAFLQYVRRYIFGFAFKRIAKTLEKAKKYGKTLSLEETIKDPKKAEKEVTLADRIADFKWDPMRQAEEMEFKRNIEKIKKELAKNKAKKVFEYLAMGYRQVDIAGKLKMTPMGVNQIIQRDIKPVAVKYMAFKSNRRLIRFLKSIMEM